MTRELEKNVVDPSLRAWILPKFSTTTTTDTIVASVIMMSSMKKYFDFKFCLMCGLPSVTLEGKKEDWEDILRRPVEKLKEYGVEAIGWYHLALPKFGPEPRFEPDRKFRYSRVRTAADPPVRL